MPLENGSSHEVISRNIEELVKSGYDQKQAAAIAYKQAGSESKDAQPIESKRTETYAGYLLIDDNPIICAGVFPYSGSQLPEGEPGKIYQVYRPLEELTKPETLESLKGIPIIDEHEMLGEKYNRGPEERGVHGAILENIKAIGNDILATLSIFSLSLKALIDAGKRGLSLGYNCRFEKAIGEYDGMRYDYIQRDIRGNHLALVTQGRNGTIVLDSAVMDEFDLNIKEFAKMAEENNKDTTSKDTEKKALTLDEVHAYMKENAPMWHELQAMMSKEEGGESDAALDADTKEKDGDQKKAEDEDEDKKDDKAEDKKVAMDAADIEALVNAKLKGAVKSFGAKISKRDALAKRLEGQIGTFAFDNMDVADVAAYGAKKLGLNASAGQELTAVEGYLTAAEKFKNKTTFAMDSVVTSKVKEGGLLSKTLNKASA